MRALTDYGARSSSQTVKKKKLPIAREMSTKSLLTTNPRMKLRQMLMALVAALTLGGASLSLSLSSLSLPLSLSLPGVEHLSDHHPDQGPIPAIAEKQQRHCNEGSSSSLSSLVFSSFKIRGVARVAT